MTVHADETSTLDETSANADEMLSSSRDFSGLLGLWPYLRVHRFALFFAVSGMMVTAFILLGLGQGVRILIDHGLTGAHSDMFNMVLVGLLGVVVVFSIASFSRVFLIAWIGENVVADLRRDIFNHVIGLSSEFFETQRVGAILSRIGTDTTLVQTVIGTSVTQTLRGSVVVLGGSILLMVTNPKLTGIAVLAFPLVIVPVIILARRVRRHSRETQDRIAEAGAYAEETLRSVQVVHACGHEQLDREQFGERVMSAFRVSVRQARNRSAMIALLILSVFTSIAVVLWVGGNDVMAGRITPGELSSFIFYAILVAGSISALSEVFGELLRAAGAMDRLTALLKHKTNITSPPEPKAFPEPSPGRVEFDRVAFFYPSRPTMPALDTLSFTVEPGETVALVGPSGAGKSTVFQLLLRFYDPVAGAVRIDGVDLREAALGDARGRIGFVPQDSVMFSGTIMENIRYARPDADDFEVQAAAAASQSYEFIAKLPDGFDTYLGEKGVRISGGQRQRISIARAILRDPSILLLDEATSALDAESERAVQRALEVVMDDRTTLVIAHRLATVLRADRIFVLDQGQISAVGSHDDLLTSSPLYARLAALQFGVGAGRHAVPVSPDTRAAGAGAVSVE